MKKISENKETYKTSMPSLGCQENLEGNTFEELCSNCTLWLEIDFNRQGFKLYTAIDGRNQERNRWFKHKN